VRYVHLQRAQQYLTLQIVEFYSPQTTKFLIIHLFDLPDNAIFGYLDISELFTVRGRVGGPPTPLIRFGPIPVAEYKLQLSPVLLVLGDTDDMLLKVQHQRISDILQLFSLR